MGNPSVTQKEKPNRSSMRVRVLLFSVLRDRVGTNTLDVMLPHAANGERLLQYLGDTYPVIAAFGSAIRLARNEEYAPIDCVLEDGDEIALITPVSGG